jgi:hypothetical protein
MSEPILFMWGAYVGALLGVVMIANTLMRWATRRLPRLTTARLIGLTFLFMCLMDFIMESIWLTTGAYTYGGAVRGLSLWAGHYYQFPVYEIVLFGAAWTAFACVRFFKNDRGETIAERGAAELRVKRMAPVRFLALIGIFNLIFLAYNVTVAVAGMYADNYPKDILNRPYLTDNVCGAYTNQACPGPQIPVPVGAKSGHVTPQGTFVAPNGLPIQVSNGH